MNVILPCHSMVRKWNQQSKHSVRCCKGVPGSLTVSTALWHIWAEHSPFPLLLTQRGVRGLQCCIQRGHSPVWWQHQCGVREQEGWLMQARVAGWGMRKQSLESSEHIMLSCYQYSFTLRRQLFFLIIRSTKHIFRLFGMVQSVRCSHWKLYCLEMRKSVFEESRILFLSWCLIVCQTLTMLSAMCPASMPERKVHSGEEWHKAVILAAEKQKLQEALLSGAEGTWSLAAVTLQVKLPIHSPPATHAHRGSRCSPLPLLVTHKPPGM